MEEKKLELGKSYPCILQKVENVFQELYDHYRVIVSRNEYLEKENARLKEDTYKDEELSKMKEQYEKMKKAYFLGFPISEEEDKEIKEWIEKRPEFNEGAIGGRYTYQFTPTSIGMIGTVIDGMTGEKFTFQELV